MSYFRTTLEQAPDVYPTPEMRLWLSVLYEAGHGVAWMGDYEEYLQTPLWREFRGEILERDHHRCRLCSRDERLDVHHASYLHLGAEQHHEVLTLCHGCHWDFHKRRGLRKLGGMDGSTDGGATKGQRSQNGKGGDQTPTQAPGDIAVPSP